MIIEISISCLEKESPGGESSEVSMLGSPWILSRSLLVPPSTLWMIRSSSSTSLIGIGTLVVGSTKKNYKVLTPLQQNLTLTYKGRKLSFILMS